MSDTFTMSVAEAREATITDEPNPYAIRAAADERAQAAKKILDRCIVEKRDKTASEQREFDKLTTELDELRQLEALAASKLAASRAEVEEARAATFAGIPGFGGGPSSGGGGELGDALAQAVVAVREGRSTFEVVEARELRSLRSRAEADEQRTLTTTGDGSYLVPIDLKAPGATLRPASVLLGMPGVNIVPMRSDRMRVPRLGEDDIEGVGEAEDLPETNGDIDARDAYAQKFGAIRHLSSEEVEDASSDVLQLIGSALVASAGRKVDHGLLEGQGAKNVVGIRHQPGINTTSVAGKPTNFAKFAEVLYEARAADADPRFWIMHPRSWFVLSTIKTGISSDETTLLEPNPQLEGDTLLGLAVRQSTQLTLTEGAGAGSWVGAVDPTQLIVGERRPARFEVSRDFKFDEDVVSIRVTCRYAFGLLNPEGVSIATDVRAS